ncbi:MAG: PAN domain-containing protein [Polyangiaceae bacterium]
MARRRAHRARALAAAETFAQTRVQGGVGYSFDTANYWGTELQILSMTDPQACASACDREPRCVVASFHDATVGGKYNLKCVLRSERGSPHPENSGVHSWLKGSAPGAPGLGASEAKADAARSPERVDRAALRAASVPVSTPLPTAQVTARYGATIEETFKKFPNLKPAILSLDPAFFNWPGVPARNTVLRLADGSEVLLMSGCRNMVLCSSTGYVLTGDFSHSQLALIEVESASPPQSYLIFGGPAPALRSVLLSQAAIAFAKAAPDSDAALLKGVTMLPAANVPDYGDPGGLPQSQPELASAIQRVYGGDVMLVIDGYCGVRMGDGREFVLLPAVTPGAQGRVPHTIAYDKTSKVAFVYRSEGELGKEAWFGNPDNALRGLLSVASNGCYNFRAKMGVVPNGHY